jgi:hypothetical protein
MSAAPSRIQSGNYRFGSGFRAALTNTGEHAKRDRPITCGRVADGIRTRDIQIHNLDTASPNHDQESELRQTSQDFAHYLPTDTCQTDPDLAAVVAAWPELPEAIRAGILAMVKAASK